MKSTAKITLSAMMTALTAVFMLTSYFPYLTYAIPAVAGLFIMVTVIETDKKWALVSYIASAIIVFLTAEPEAKLLYIVFFGYYPIVKSALEQISNRVVEYILKFAVFNGAVILTYTVFAGIFGVPLEDMNDFGKYTAIILLAAANVAFPIYDLAVSKMAGYYMAKLHPTVRKMLKF